MEPAVSTTAPQIYNVFKNFVKIFKIIFAVEKFLYKFAITKTIKYDERELFS